jgi:pyruvate dehydrogenase E2 component (dihydrolipoamide acetyltransferase)
MAKELYIPKLGQTVEEVTLVKWLRNDGDIVARGDEVLEVETDKAVFPVEANGKGVLHIGPFTEGQVVPILTVVAIIGKAEDTFVASTLENEEKTQEIVEQAEKPSVDTQESAEQSEHKEQTDRIFASPRARKTAHSKDVSLEDITPSGGKGIRIIEKDVLRYAESLPNISPVALRLAEQTGVDWKSLPGTGVGGKITKEDIENAISTVSEEADIPVIVPTAVSSVPMTGIRKIIADRMAESVHTSARVTLVMDVDATEFVAARDRIKTKYAKEWGFTPGYNDLLAKVVAQALVRFPYMNAQLHGDEIRYMDAVNLGMAVDTERGLLVPVIKDAANKNLKAFGTEFRDLVEKARTNRLLPTALEGGTFTITNLGMYDVEAFTPVINLPEAAILGVGKIGPKPVVIDGEIVIRLMWTLSLVFDHRIVDGAPAARFMQFIKQVIEDPFLLLT